MKRYRKRPIVIEAIEYTSESCAEVCTFLGIEHHDVGRCGIDSPLVVYTLEGKLTASAGDWIIKGVAGEFYPCKPDIFEATYEAVE